MTSISVTVRPRTWRVLHDWELGAPWRKAPEVFRFQTHDFAPFTRDWQLFAFDMIYESAGDVFDIAFLKEAFTKMYAWNLVMCNGGAKVVNGFGRDDEPRANFVAGENLDAPLPKIANLVFGGTVLRGRPDGTHLLCRVLDPREDPPRVIEPWMVQKAITAQMDGEVARFPQLCDASRQIYRDVPYPLTSRVEARFPLDGLVES